MLKDKERINRQNEEKKKISIFCLQLEQFITIDNLCDLGASHFMEQGDCQYLVGESQYQILDWLHNVKSITENGKLIKLLPDKLCLATKWNNNFQIDQLINLIKSQTQVSPLCAKLDLSNNTLWMRFSSIEDISKVTKCSPFKIDDKCLFYLVNPWLENLKDSTNVTNSNIDNNNNNHNHITI